MVDRQSMLPTTRSHDPSQCYDRHAPSRHVDTQPRRVPWRRRLYRSVCHINVRRLTTQWHSRTSTATRSPITVSASNWSRIKIISVPIHPTIMSVDPKQLLLTSHYGTHRARHKGTRDTPTVLTADLFSRATHQRFQP